MTDKQIVDFIVGRAKKNGGALKLSDLRLGICFEDSAHAYLVLYDHDICSCYYWIRFTFNEKRSLFNIKPNDPEMKQWLMQQFKSKRDVGELLNLIEYDVDVIPDGIKHFVSYAIIQTLKTPNYGLDATNIKNDIDLIMPNETYEEAVIESDFMSILDY